MYPVCRVNATSAGSPPLDYGKWSVRAARFAADELDQYCSTSDTVATIYDLRPNFLPWSTPTYSDLNFMFQGVAISNITGKSIIPFIKMPYFSR